MQCLRSLNLEPFLVYLCFALSSHNGDTTFEKKGNEGCYILNYKKTLTKNVFISLRLDAHTSKILNQITFAGEFLVKML